MSKQKLSSVENNSAQQIQTVAASDLDIAQKDVSPRTVAVYIRSLLQNWRQGTVACKGRSDVAYSNKKPWKQKGTGRARAGSARSPLWRGGGVIFGPQPRVRTLKASKKTKRGALNSILYDFLNNKRVVLLNWDENIQKPNTAQAFKLLKDSSLHNEKIVLFLPSHDAVTYASYANIPNIRILFYDQPNAFDLANSDYWLVLKKDFEHFKKMVSQWI